MRLFVTRCSTALPTLAAVVFIGALAGGIVSAQDATRPTVMMAESATIRVLTGLDVRQFEHEMQLFNQALGVNCGFCHARGDFTSDANPRKQTARRMIEMTKALNTQFFPDYATRADDSLLGRVTCYTCHQGAETPLTAQGTP